MTSFAAPGCFYLMPKTAQTNSPIKLPPATDWRTTDTDEINKRRQRAREGSFVITNTAPTHPVFSNFRVKSGSGQAYLVEVRDIATRQFACDCVDFRINGRGTCKRVEAVLLELPKRNKGLYEAACRSGSRRIEVVVDGANTLRVLNGREPLPPSVAKWFDAHGRLANGSPERALESLR